MKRIFSFIVVILLGAGLFIFLFAEENEEKMMNKDMMEKGSTMNKNHMSAENMKKCDKQMKQCNKMMKKCMMMQSGKKMGMMPMHKMMMKKQMVATEDGGVIIMVGNKLLKYDEDLNLEKEVEIKIDYEAMHKMMNKDSMMKDEMKESDE